MNTPQEVELNLELMPVTTDKAKLAMWLWQNVIEPVQKAKDARIKELEDWGTKACIRSENLFQLREDQLIREAQMKETAKASNELLSRTILQFEDGTPEELERLCLDISAFFKPEGIR